MTCGGIWIDENEVIDMVGAKMTNEEMVQFIKDIGRCELFHEMEDAKKLAHVYTTWSGYPRYLKAIRVSLVALGYDEEWVDTEFKEALDEYYLGGQAAIDNKEKLEMADMAGKMFADIMCI